MYTTPRPQTVIDKKVEEKKNSTVLKTRKRKKTKNRKSAVKFKIFQNCLKTLLRTKPFNFSYI